MYIFSEEDQQYLPFRSSPLPSCGSQITSVVYQEAQELGFMVGTEDGSFVMFILRSNNSNSNRGGNLHNDNTELVPLYCLDSFTWKHK